ncbi:DUF6538 domain-containing protein [Loktanella salsilacus]|uniref:DUF6538 domain-containing protein n=1 Tax=Loktanella salsilacus TaxID=195913 RepID=UPI0030038DA1
MVLRMPRPTKANNGIWQYRVRVPADVVESVGRDVIKESLHTRDEAEAIKRFTIRHAQSLAEWDKHRTKLTSPPRKLSHKECVALAGRMRDIWLSVFDENPGDEVRWARLMADDIRARLGLGSLMVGEAGVLDSLNKRFGPFVDQTLFNEGIVVDQATREKLIPLFEKAMHEANRINLMKAGGDYSEDDEAKKYPAWSNVAPKERLIIPTDAKPTLMDLFDDWEKLHLQRGKREKTIKDFRQKVDHLHRFIKQKPAGELTRAELRKWRDHLLETGGPQGKPLSTQTVSEKYFAAVKAVLSLAHENERINDDPSKEIKVRKAKPKLSRDRAFTTEEATAILAAASAVVGQETKMATKTRLAVRWVPWIMAYTGARVSEIVQMRRQDIATNDGVVCFTITPDAGSTKSSLPRRIPVHQHLIDQGLLDVVAASADDFIFAAARKEAGETTPITTTAQNAVRSLVRESAGITDENLQPNHGWRHRLKTQMINLDVAERVQNAIFGHSASDAASRYGSVSIAARQAAIKKLPRYDVSGLEQRRRP